MSRVLKVKDRRRDLSANRNVVRGLPRIADFLLALVGLVVFSPLLIVGAILVRFSSEGTVFFRQKRVGRNGKLFTVLKFRTMHCSSSGPLVTASDDCRITKIGSFLRRYKFDELPELINVLKGDMAFVGPRPEVPEMVDLSDERWRQVLRVRPGITDPVTLYLRNEESILAQVEDKVTFYEEVLQPFKLQNYIDYLNVKTWISDLSVIFQTIVAVFVPRPHTEPIVKEMRPIGAERN